MVAAVGTTIDDEGKGPRFRAWWKETQHEPMLQFMGEVRAAAHRRGRRRATRVVFASASLGFQIGGSATAHVIDRDGRAVEDSEPPSPLLQEPPPPEPPKASTDPPPQWEFVGEGKFKGGEFDGQEVFGFLDRYLAWLRDCLIPTAERLTT